LAITAVGTAKQVYDDNTTLSPVPTSQAFKHAAKAPLPDENAKTSTFSPKYFFTRLLSKKWQNFVGKNEANIQHRKNLTVAILVIEEK
jgi:hypothetical protein